MPKGSKGEMRPANVIGCAVHVAQIATGAIPDEAKPTCSGPSQWRSEGRSEIARLAASARWE